MTIIYTPTHVDAAAELRDACAAVYNALDHEPTTGSPLWDQWNDQAYQPAWDRHLWAETAYARMFPAGHAPHSLDVIASTHRILNPLRATNNRGMYRTDDNRFVVSPYLPDRQKAGKWAIVFVSVGMGLVFIDATDRQHAQQIVDLITWATTDGARNGEN